MCECSVAFFSDDQTSILLQYCSRSMVLLLTARLQVVIDRFCQNVIILKSLYTCCIFHLATLLSDCVVLVVSLLQSVDL